jgi:hypothetical protein
VNAELLAAQEFLLEKAEAEPGELSRIIEANPRLRFKTYLRFEQQPRAYHWILADYCDPGSFDAQTIIGAYRERTGDYLALRDRWIEHIAERNPHLTDKQTTHLRSRNRKLNLATRLVHVLPPGDPVWTQDLDGEVEGICDAMVGLKPLIDFFLLG